MKYSEAKTEVHRLGYTFTNNKNDTFVSIRDSDDRTLILISKTYRYCLDTMHHEFSNLNEFVANELVEISIELASTPIEEREEEEKKYRLKFIGEVDDEYCYLNIKSDGSRVFDSKKNHKLHQTIFTESELEEIDETGFVREEVTE